jgi:hypothetical protein
VWWCKPNAVVDLQANLGVRIRKREMTSTHLEAALPNTYKASAVKSAYSYNTGWGGPFSVILGPQVL